MLGKSPISFKNKKKTC